MFPNHFVKEDSIMDRMRQVMTMGAIGLISLCAVPALMQERDETGFDLITAENAPKVNELYRIQPAEAYESGSQTLMGEIYDMTYSHDGQWLATTGYGSVIKVWDMKTGDLLRAWTLEEEQKNFFKRVQFSPDDRWLVVSGHFGDIMAVFDLNTGKEMPLFDPAPEVEGEGYKNFSFGADGRIAVGFVPRRDLYAVSRVEIWDLNTQTLLHQLPAAENFRYSPDGRYLMSGAFLYDSASLQALHEFAINTSDSDSRDYFLFLKNSPALLYKIGNTLGSWNSETRQWGWQMERDSADFSFVVVPDEQTVFLTERKEQGVWFSPIVDIETGEILTVWDENTGITLEEFSPNGQLMLLSAKDSVEVWDISDFADKKYLATIYKGTQPYGVFGPDGRTILVSDRYDPELQGYAVVLGVAEG